MAHREKHHTHRVGWLRAAVLGANDGIVSTASLLIGISASGATRGSVMIAGIAGLVAGAMSMAAGEYVSVHSQADTEKADLEKEEKELARSPLHELQELTEIYIDRGLSQDLALQVAIELTEHDALGAHARDELGITEISSARPLQAAGFSAVSFAIGAALPLAAAYISPPGRMIPVIAISSLLFLSVLGGLAARAGGANILIGASRVLFWGTAAMAATFLVGWMFGTSVA
jgi:vacuolar iron transporter family protein